MDTFLLVLEVIGVYLTLALAVREARRDTRRGTLDRHDRLVGPDEQGEPEDVEPDLSEEEPGEQRSE
ncbi:hypothetical protein [Streptomyces sp. NPDC050535]|uniref:hypothetical protein n=1 Tax=Streptomyces sp. NPDC050535 TaxID=3365626 RepID=UPI0037B0DB64